MRVTSDVHVGAFMILEIQQSVRPEDTTRGQGFLLVLVLALFKCVLLAMFLLGLI